MKITSLKLTNIRSIETAEYVVFAVDFSVCLRVYSQYKRRCRWAEGHP